MTYSLSIIIVNFNTGDLLRDCVASVYRTTGGFRKPRCEVIIVDNNSDDESVEKLRAKSEKRKATAKNLKLVKNKNNLGFAKAVNQGVRASKGEYVLLLNPDTVVRKGAISRMLEFAQSTPDVGVVGARLLNKDGSVQESAMHFPTLWRAIQEYWFGRKDAYSKYAITGNAVVEVDAVVGAAFLITPEARRKVGLLDERFWMYFEDLDYCRRVRSVGLRTYYLPGAHVVHSHGASARTISDKGRRYLSDSAKVYHGPLKHALITFVLWSGQKVRGLRR